MKNMMAGCPAERTLRLIGGRWKVFIVSELFSGTRRFSDLQRGINAVLTVDVTPKMLTQELRQMEADGLIHRKVYAQVPPKVEYSLTPLGLSLQPVIAAMVDWGRQHELKMEGSVQPCTNALKGSGTGSGLIPVLD